MNETKLHPAAQATVDRFRALNLGGKQVTAVYHINAGHIKDLRVMVGKGTPEEIEMEVKIWAQLKGIDLDKADAETIREFMRVRRIGIDCSGFVYHVFASWLQATLNESLLKQIKFPYKSLFGSLKLWLRPAENIGADILTSELNAFKIELKDIRPGDLIRSKSVHQGVDHILLVSSVSHNDQGLPVAFNYVHSTKQFGKDNGVREGRVNIVDVNAELKDQDWLEIAADGVKYTLEGLKINYADNGLRRPNYFEKLKLD
jgi:hypothetical protein